MKKVYAATMRVLNADDIRFGLALERAGETVVSWGPYPMLLGPWVGKRLLIYWTDEVPPEIDTLVLMVAEAEKEQVIELWDEAIVGKDDIEDWGKPFMSVPLPLNPSNILQTYRYAITERVAAGLPAMAIVGLAVLGMAAAGMAITRKRR